MNGATGNSMKSVLDGIRIVDLTSVVMGPLATQLLGDFGADVIKVESPEGDTTRRVGPMRNPLMGWVYLHLNRNKRSLVLDLKQQAARDALIRLAQTADVLVASANAGNDAGSLTVYCSDSRRMCRCVGTLIFNIYNSPQSGF